MPLFGGMRIRGPGVHLSQSRSVAPQGAFPLAMTIGDVRVDCLVEEPSLVPGVWDPAGAVAMQRSAENLQAAAATCAAGSQSCGR